MSVNESWHNGSPEVQDVLIDFAALGHTAGVAAQGRSPSERAWPGLGLQGKGKRSKGKGANKRLKKGYRARWGTRTTGDGNGVTTCSIEGCERPVYARGWCTRHWYRWRYHGSPTAGRPVGQDGSGGVCSVEGCARPAAARGWCRTHHRRWLRHGSPLVRGVIETPAIGTQRFCSVDGCDRPHEAHGLCSMHRARWVKHGTTQLPPSKPTPLCSVVHCDRPARTLGLCHKHYQRWRMHGSTELQPRTPMERRGCSVEGCDRSAKARGFCHKHYMAYRRRDPETRQRVLDYGRHYRRRYRTRERQVAEQAQVTCIRSPPSVLLHLLSAVDPRTPVTAARGPR